MARVTTATVQVSLGEVIDGVVSIVDIVQGNFRLKRHVNVMLTAC